VASNIRRNKSNHRSVAVRSNLASRYCPWLTDFRGVVAAGSQSQVQERASGSESAPKAETTADSAFSISCGENFINGVTPQSETCTSFVDNKGSEQ
jgi:hypothetical protein